ncbi:MAG: D-glucuronyl C5-epimerase family protein [Rhizobiaceae bacterium]|nr:D-glucuronyl C5-epimerase family protein [Rhizobiaceae bacterium]
MHRTSKAILSAALAALVTLAIMNSYAQEISDLNAGLRSYLTGGPSSVRSFSSDGLPRSYSPHVEGGIISPFYVVHYGILYSETCRKSAFAGSYHWSHDASLAYWPFPPDDISIEKFKASADWLVENARVGDRGLAHLFYNFDWPYQFYPDGKLKAPWWSGLTDAYATTLLLRAWDCFGDRKYLDTAKRLYESAIAPISTGGSLSLLNGAPWIDEYVDPRMPPEELSKVLNGMIYSYHAIRGYEAFAGTGKMSSALRTSIYMNLRLYDMGYWSRYDALGSIANIKYHAIQTALIEDRRLNDGTLDGLAIRWKIGRAFPVLFYTMFGPPSVSKVQFVMTLVAMFLALFATMLLLLDRALKPQTV